MSTGHQPPVSASLQVGGKDEALQQRLDDELTAFNDRATGAGQPVPLSVRVTDSEGELVGGLTAWAWGSLCAIDMLWVREDQRHAGWGSKLLRAAEEEGARQGCTEVIVSSFTFQAPGFYQRHGYRESGRTVGIPGGHQDVHFHKALKTGH
ncbi:GNAT family N-acetyltransferase [Streptomyces sp. NPDC005808]|uniref:GNAT family N-acetyltransferase n=1 Tax=Streptomyces sp. NPDC005808 TaxID=3364734 RepID=UPI0036D08DE1